MGEVIPKGVKWIQAAADRIDPAANTVHTTTGETVTYDYLAVATGVVYDWDQIPGLKEGLGTNGITTNYQYDTAQYTWEALQNLTGGNAIFTQPATPVKCGGAPQKIMYLTDHYLRKQNRRDNVNLAFFTPGTVIFGVEAFRKTLEKIVAEREIATNFYMKPVEVRPDARQIVFEYTGEGSLSLAEADPGGKLGATLEGGKRLVVPFELLHTAPPHAAPEVIQKSPLAHQEGPMKGWMNVDQYTLQSPDYPNVFGLGDVAGIPNAKSGAAVRQEVPVVERNLHSVMTTGALPENASTYDGYSSCPIVTGYGRLVLAEFDYNNEPQPSFPFDTTKERWSMYMLKKYIIPWMYWNRMLKGKM
jgi:sulfide:quinone oxidoreductase